MVRLRIRAQPEPGALGNIPREKFNPSVQLTDVLHQAKSNLGGIDMIWKSSGRNDVGHAAQGNRTRLMDGTVVEWGDFPAIRYGEWLKVHDLYGEFYVPVSAGITPSEIASYCVLDDGNLIKKIDYHTVTGFGCRYVDKNCDNNKCWVLMPTLRRAENHLYAMVQDNPEWAEIISDVGEMAMDEAREHGYEGE